MRSKETQTPWTPEKGLEELRKRLPADDWEFGHLERCATWRSGEGHVVDWKGTYHKAEAGSYQVLVVTVTEPKEAE